MTEISASAVKELRERTGAGMMDCKKALSEAAGNMEDAIDWLRKRGLAQAAKKAGRTTAEGLVGVCVEGNSGAVVEVNAETDFVARNEHFQEYVRTVARLALSGFDSVEDLKAADYPGTGRSVGDELTHLVSIIGENMALRRVKCLKVSQGAVSSYIHNALADGLGRVGVLVALEGDINPSEADKLGKSIAMHVAAAHPQAVSIESVNPAELAREEAIQREKAEQSGKPAEVIEKMVEGSLRKYYEQIVLAEQVYMIDDTKRKVSAVIKDKATELGGNLKLADFAHFKLGEGIEKSESDFAAEVASLTK